MIGSIKIHDDIIPIDPNDIFQRILILLMNQPPEELPKIFEYELAPYPQSLFDMYGFR